MSTGSIPKTTSSSSNTTITTTTTAITEHPKPHQEACTAMTTMFKTMRMPVSARKDRHYFSCLRPLQQSGPADDCRRPVPKALASRLGSCVKWHIDVSNHEDLTWDRSSPEMQLWFLGTRAERRVMPTASRPRRLPGLGVLCKGEPRLKRTDMLVKQEIAFIHTHLNDYEYLYIYIYTY